MRTIISIAARTQSTRLPSKVLSPIFGRPMLELILERLRRAKDITVVVATTTDPRDEPILRIANRMGVGSITGSPTDLMTRHWQAAATYDADLILLAGADDPFLDPAIFEMVRNRLLIGDMPYVKTAGWPLGLNAWGWTREAMDAGNRRAVAPEEREHVVPFWERRPHEFPQAVIRRPGADLYGLYRVTVDALPDLVLTSRVYGSLYAVNPQFTAEDVIALLDANPDIAAVNSHGLQGAAARDAIYSIEPVEEGVTA